MTDQNKHPNTKSNDITIWDRIVRLCHWMLVACFVTNYFIVEPGRLYHEIAGYTAVSFIFLRLIWGFTRPITNYASFRTVNLHIREFKQHIQHLKQRDVPAQHGHNPFGWLMIFAVIILFLGLGVTGFTMEEVDAFFGNSTLEWIHGTFADVLYACVLIHVAAVFFVQYKGRVQLLRPMLVGKRKVAKKNS